jgi:predicted metalloendopeptidase
MTLPSGIPSDGLDPGIRPQDDLFRHVNGQWLATGVLSYGPDLVRRPLERR